MSARRVWNQHAYHVTNVCDGSDTACVGIENVNGGIPRQEQVPWRMGLNGFRVNSQRGARERNAADLIVLALNADVSRCPATYTLRADIGNRGALSVPADMPVTFYQQIAGGMPVRLGTVQIGRTLLPGGTVRVELPVMPAMGGQFDVFVVPNDDGMGGHPYRECNPDDNRSEIRRVDCTLIG